MNIILKSSLGRISLEEAFKKNFIRIKGSSLICTNNEYRFCPSTNLYDINDNEIYLDDTLVDDKSGIIYKVIQYYSTIYLKKIDGQQGCILETLANYKSGNHIPFKIVK